MKIYYNNLYFGPTKSIPVWTVKDVDNMIQSAKQGKLGETYGTKDTNELRDALKHTPGIKDGRALVIGSTKPWVEACVLEAGANEIVTLEYIAIHSKHPQLKTMVPLEFRRHFLENKLEKFDAVVTFSSVEHSALGRFGDMLNPWGDIIAIARVWCVAKDGGYLTIEVQCGDEKMQFIAGRRYDKVRFPYLTTNWRQYHQGYGIQRPYVFRKDIYIYI